MMEKKVLIFIVATLMLVLTLGLLVACSNTDTPVIDGDGTGVSPAPTPTPDQGGNNGGGSQTPVEPDDKASIVSIVNGSVEGLDCYLEVSPSTVNIDLSGSIEVSKDSSWQLYADVLGQQLIPTKYAANLVDGDNIYYVVVNSADGTVNRTYTLHIWRNFYVDVMFVSEGEVVKTLTRTTHTYISNDEFISVSRTGYTHTGWTNHTDGEDYYITGYNSSYSALSSTITFDAKFSANDYTITLDANGGSCGKDSVEVTYDSYFELPVPTRTGYTFDGWEYNGTKITTTSGSCITGFAYDKNITAKARWNINYYTLTVNNANTAAGSISTSGGSKAYGQSVTITVSPYSGYTFAGWYKDGTKVSDGTSYIFTMPANDVTYTAIWEINAEMQNFEFTSTTTTCTITGVKDTTLTSIIIPDSVTTIGYEAFQDCTSLTSVTFVENSQLTSIDDRAFYSCGSLTSITIPDSVTSIGSDAFRDCDSLTSVTFVENSQLTSIDDRAFYSCGSLTSITIPDSVTSIGSDAFRGCIRLVEVFNKSNLTITADSTSNGYVGYYALNVYTEDGGSKISTDEDGYIIYTNGADKILVGYVGNETELTIPDDITEINKYAFYNCTSLTSVTIGDSVTTIGSWAFNDCDSLTSIVIPDSVTTIGYEAFQDCYSLTSVVIPDSVTTIGDYAFRYCSGLTSVTIGDSVTTIGDDAFSGCTSLTSVTFGANSQLTTIGYAAFRGCSSLESLTIPFVGEKAGVTGSSTYQYPLGYLFGTSSYTGGVATTQYYYGSSTSSTTSRTYYIPSSLKSVTVTGGYIPRGAFYNCNNITNITLGDDVTTIGSYAFYNCTRLTSISVEENNPNYKSIDGNLYSKSGKTLIQYAIGKTATSFVIPDSVTTIGSYAFYDCDSLKNVYYTGTEEEWNSITIDTGNESLTNAARYYYSECVHDNNQWRYDADGNISTVLTVGEWVVDTEPTCTTNGSKHTTSTCSVCDETVTLEIPALGHSAGDDGTCTVCGEVMYTITNDATYPFVETDGVLQSTNKEHISSSSYVITANTTITITFEYNVSSESPHDNFYIYHNTTQKVVKSGTPDSYTSYSITLNAGDTLTFMYTKDGRQSRGADCCYIKNLTIT